MVHYKSHLDKKKSSAKTSMVPILSFWNKTLEFPFKNDRRSADYGVYYFTLFPDIHITLLRTTTAKLTKHSGEEQNYSGLQFVEFDILNLAECQGIKIAISMKF